jgi:hypothetical protein
MTGKIVDTATSDTTTNVDLFEIPAAVRESPFDTRRAAMGSLHGFEIVLVPVHPEPTLGTRGFRAPHDPPNRKTRGHR